MQMKLFAVAVLALLSVASASTCDANAKILIWGGIDGNFPGWLQGKIAGSVLDRVSESSTLTQALMTPYHLVIFGQISRQYSTAESNAVVAYLDNGGAVISLAGFYDNCNDARAAEQVLRGLGVTYDCSALITGLDLATEVVSGPTSAGVASISFVGGWRSSPYTGPGTSSYILNAYVSNIGARADLGQTIIRPSGGRLVAWGDEWLTFAPPNNLYNQIPGTAQFWLNAVAWVTQGKVCPSGSQTQTPCGATKFTASSSCNPATFHSSTKGFTLSFSKTASGCSFSN